MARKIPGPEQFEKFYSDIYAERWETLKESLSSSHQAVAYTGPFIDKDLIPALDGASEVSEHVFFRDGVWPRPELVDYRGEELKNYYLLDYASYICAKLLATPERDCRYLDLCSAPGGKGLIIAGMMSEGSTLICNELSQKRRERLRTVVEEYLPSDIRERVKVTGHDAGRWCLYEKDAFDAVLLDAPCSSERHLLQKPVHLKDWAPGRTKRLAREQWKLLSSAYLVLRPGGRLVYSTCSISPFENDEVVRKLVQKYGDQVKVSAVELPIGEATEFGHLVLPDKSNHGPLYISLIERIA